MDSAEEGYISILTMERCEKFKCNICNRYLSVGPILFNETVGKVCGRCVGKGETKKFGKITFESQKVYEEIAEHIVFPCSFREKGCGESLKWNSTHEDTCPYKDNKCPFGLNVLAHNNCLWNGDNKYLSNHLTTGHKDSFYELSNISTTFPCNLQNSIMLSLFDDNLIVAMLSVSNDSKSIAHKLWMDIPYIKCKSFTYDLEVSNENGKHHMTFPENEITPLYNSVFTNNCGEYEFDLNIDGLLTLLKSKEKLNFWFKIKPPQLNKLMNSGTEFSLGNSIVFDWKCSNCKKMLHSPIYLCYNNHNCCYECYQNISYCFCGVSVSKYKNDLLENLSKVSYYICKNKEQGCSALLTSEQLTFHENNCKLTEKLCMIEGCSWTANNVNMLKHVIDKHCPISLDEAITFEFENIKKSFYMIFDEHIFVFTIDYIPKDSLSITCQCVGVTTVKYLFEFEIFSDFLKLECNHFCEPFFYGDNIKQPQAIVYPFDFLKKFLTEPNKFSFKIRILNATNDG